MTTSLFGTAIETSAKAGSTAESIRLTNVSTEMAASNIKLISAMEDQEAAKQLINNSFTNNSVMDVIVKGYLAADHIEDETDKENAIREIESQTAFLKDISKEAAIKMLKSQQSKRSRVKNEVLIQANYVKSMTAAFAEALIRTYCNIPASNVRSSGRRVELELTDEMIENYKNSQDLLAKAIRNIQSKKTIAKKKADFDENSEDYQTLLNFEQSLKMLRTDKVHVVETIVERLIVDPEMEAKANKVDAAHELLSSLDPDKMKKSDMAKIMAEVQEMLMSDVRGN